MENNLTPTKHLASDGVAKVGINIASEIQIANVGKQIKDCTDEEIKQVLRYIFVLLGTKADLIPDGLAKDVLLNFIKDRLWLLTIDELKLAFVYAVEKRTEVELTLFGETFSAKTILEVVDCFNKYKRNILNKVKKELPEPEKKTEYEVNEILKNACLKSFDEFRKGVAIFDHGNVKYNYLVKAGVLNFTKERKEAIYRLAEERVRQDAIDNKGKAETISRAINSIQPDTIISASKKEALNQFFKDLADTETELSDLL